MTASPSNFINRLFFGYQNAAALKAALEKRYGKKIEATVSIDPTLIGGARVTVGDTVIDASVRGELQAMSSQLRV